HTTPGGSSGIGKATAELFASQGARVLNLDVNPPSRHVSSDVEYVRCDQSSWSDILAAFKFCPQIDIVVANGGITESPNYFDDEYDEDGDLREPSQSIFKVNLIGTINVCKIAMSRMRRQPTGGSIVVTSSATALMPEHSLPVYGACKTALLGLVRALRCTSMLEHITINAVAPAATISNQLPEKLAKPIIEAGLPVSSAAHVALAILYAATGSQDRQVERYGKDRCEDDRPGPWNGRTILTLGDTWTEVEEPLVACRSSWFGLANERLTQQQQAITDQRQLPDMVDGRPVAGCEQVVYKARGDDNSLYVSSD
ncbi:NAD(P)-binding protein, partial [Teratosphaeria nubilosa]